MFARPETSGAKSGISAARDTETALRESLGVKNILWLGKGIAGDDTHGHVDDLCRFVDRRTVVLVREKNRHDANYQPLEENWERLRGARLEDGSKVEAWRCPCPRRCISTACGCPRAMRIFISANSAVLVPTFNDPNDRVALGILGELFPRPRCGRHPRGGSGVGIRHAALFDAAAARAVNSAQRYVRLAFRTSARKGVLISATLRGFDNRSCARITY